MRPSSSPSPSDPPSRSASPRAERRTIVGAIPARHGSTRLPGKPLLPLAGKPMIQHVWERARAVPGLDRVVVLTDDERIVDAVEGFGGEVLSTPADCPSGTDRIAWAARSWDDVDAVVNIQGDEPLLDPEAIGRLADHLRRHPEDPMVTLAAPARPEDRDDPNAVKVVVALDGRALYFSRSPLPFPRHPDSPAASRPWKHLGLYGYRRDVLLALAELEPTPLERAGSLEQLRALEHGIAIRVLETERPSPGVDTADDLERVERLLTGVDAR